MTFDPDGPQWWFCLRHRTVEPRQECRNAGRLGPSPTQAEAAQALETVAERNEECDNDPKWNDPDG